MIICNCSAISNKDFKSAAKATGGNVKSCFAALGKKPNCGRCFVGVNEIIDAVHNEYQQHAKNKKSVA